ncbi:MAG: ubiquinone/menaquinone biosynthesis methyltransferase [Planctomycetota bacterium]|jgi:demethylmenaquinone methyltransferase/2-methoxy-6-polyprenyl-1,4-benzoquinol methylase
MFAGIAGRYDLANRVLSGGVDRSWRRKVMAAAGKPGEGATVVDVACGTGDLALLLARRGARVVGVDFTFEMVALAPEKERAGAGPMAWVQGDGLELPLATDSADVATIAFGLRNVADRRRCIREMARVVRPGGRVLVLEFSMPRQDAFGRLYRAYLEHVLPRIGGALSGDRAAYDYLDDTVQGWPGPEQLRAEMEEDGLVDCRFDRLWRGIACIHHGLVPEGA